MFLRTTVCLLCLAILYHPQTAYGKEPLSEKRRAEEAADKFIRRWHQTLDLNRLFDEMYFADPRFERLNHNVFPGMTLIVSQKAPEYVFAPDVDEKHMRAGLIVLLNLGYLKEEHALAFGELSLEAYEQDEEEAFDLKMITREQIEKSIAPMDQTCSEYRKHLTAEIFESALYKSNLRRLQNSYEESSGAFQVIKINLSEFGGEPEVKVYRLKRGVFDFSFIEEGGELKVLKLG
jgi:hypothetical protein